MKSIFAQTKTEIYGTKNSWSLSPHQGYSIDSTLCNIDLEIQGDDKNGYHLVMSPEGFFTADHWYQTLEEALNNANELFNVDKNEWKKSTDEA